VEELGIDPVLILVGEVGLGAGVVRPPGEEAVLVLRDGSTHPSPSTTSGMDASDSATSEPARSRNQR
jgi:hypothetical protein